MEIKKWQFNRLYPLYIGKAERKGRTKEEVDEIICWLTGYTPSQLQEAVDGTVEFGEFFSSAPKPNENRALITGSICGVKLSEIVDPIDKEIRYLDKLIDELAKGKSMDKILRK